jgi:Zn-dependent peptidase ImmA (M78 family)
MAKVKIPFRKAEDIEAEAEKVLREHGQFRVPIDPIRIANALGVRVFNAAFDDESISGILARRGPNITMLINANDSGYRKRFTIAHELGHKILKHFEEEREHTDRASDLYRGLTQAEQGNSPPEEVQANRFAAALLMPAALVREEFQKTQDVDALAARFQVSADAMGNRLDTLKLI